MAEFNFAADYGKIRRPRKSAADCGTVNRPPVLVDSVVPSRYLYGKSQRPLHPPLVHGIPGNQPTLCGSAPLIDRQITVEGNLEMKGRLAASEQQKRPGGFRLRDEASLLPDRLP
jgi:hypothetical protein